MRPHHLRVQAFGPFAQAVELDLDALADAGLFLLHGETGAGKTSLLDAVVWALYGAVPGARASAGRLRSDHAPASLRTEVGLEVTLGGRRLRVTRWPAHERAKRRGTGTTTEPAGARLEELRDGTWAAVSTRVDEVSAELHDLLGMSAAQFFSVVLLPQGEFARFLRSPSDERAELLGRLFATGRFADVEEWLARRRRETARDVEEAGERLARLAARVAQAAGQEEHPEVDGPWLLALRSRLSAAADAAAQEASAAAAAQDTALVRREETARLRSRQERRRSALSRAAALEAGAAAAEVRAARLERAAAAVPVQPVVQEAGRAAAESVRCSQLVDEARRALPEDLRALRAEQLAVAAQEAARLAGALGPAVASEEASAQREAEVTAARAALEAAAVHVSGLRARRAALPGRLAAVQDAVAGSRRAAAATAGLETDAQAAVSRARAAGALVRALAVLPGAREEHVAAREAAAAAREAHVDVRTARLEGMAAELASGLAPDEPCPVCGSESHPDLLEMRPGAVGAREEEKALAVVREAEESVRRARERLAQVEQEVARLRGALSGGDLPQEPTAQDVHRLEAARDAARAALGAARAEAAQEAARLAEQAHVVAQAEALSASERAAAEQVAAARVALDERVAAMSAAARQLADARDGHRSVAERQAAQEARAVRARRAAQTEDDAQRARQEEQRLSAAAEAAAVRAGFAGAREAALALLPAEQLAAGREAGRARDAEAAAVAELLADPDVDVPLEPPADLPGAAAAAQEAVAAARAATARAHAAERARADVERLAVPLRAALDGLVPLRRAAAEVRALADLAEGRGSNSLAMRLSAFVLAARLEEVALAASARLERMTQGRYTLRHCDERRGRGRSGLGLAVLDAWTGVQRDAGSLSGGETFLASLALALGLADVVTAEAGGQRLDTLFVDEGFGSLDPEALEEVMDVLDGLREGGRLVGLVSHVAEMRSRVPAQVHVLKGRGGSTLRVAQAALAP